MHRSSESIAALAAALAKAQSEISNPEKSLVATLRAERPGEGAKSFRYAPLSSGLDIVRKALGQQQIAILQTTAIDAASGTINLTTVLAHASGEWIASDWPVCRVADTASPHRMGAALTYARRYALFTLVGIAGEDDLDAPDLNGPQPRATSGGNGEAFPESSRPHQGNRRGLRSPILDAENSAALRDQLVRDIATIPSAEDGAAWAQKALPAKNTLTASDARLVQLAFELRLSALEANPEGGQNELHAPLAGKDAKGLADPSQPVTAASEHSSALTEGQSSGAHADGIDNHPLRGPAVPGQGSPPIRGIAALPGLRPQTGRPASSALRSGPGARPQGERRIRGPALPIAPSRASPLGQRGPMVEGHRHRSA
jgi:hypothetical protein